jgi:thiol-disulfide isomerase/thioredoxin
MWALILLLPILSFSLNLNSGVNWWGTANTTEKRNEVAKKEKEKKPIQPPQKNRTEEKLTAEEIFKKSVEQFENRLRKNKTLVEYLYFKDPSNPVYQKAYKKWIEWKQKKTTEIVSPLVGYARGSHIDTSKVIEFFKAHKYVFFFFYRPDCPYCRASYGQVKELENLGFKVYWINAYEEPEMFQRWHIRATPTLIAVSKIDKKAVRWEGSFNTYSVLQYFYARLKNALKLYPSNLK